MTYKNILKSGTLTRRNRDYSLMSKDQIVADFKRTVEQSSGSVFSQFERNYAGRLSLQNLTENEAYKRGLGFHIADAYGIYRDEYALPYNEKIQMVHEIIQELLDYYRE